MDRYEQFDDVIYNEYLETGLGAFNLARDYIGGLQEDGTEYLEGAIGCIITLSEVSASEEHKAINHLYEVFNEQGYDTEISDEVIYNTFPDIRKSLTIENYSSEMDTVDIMGTIKNYLMEG